ncbi:hypothetical protein Syun_006840 [Stephania yunnanensis]|uniref:Uncharacterized protein n=1 Tax=Stephania yunnanensis TaxID=152371 RepID=A0AAP0L0S2_9MAGN
MRPSGLPLPSATFDSGMNVDYRTIPQKDLVKFVLSEGGWSKLLCTGEKVRRLVDVALVFVGKELQSSATSGNEHEDPTILHLSRSNFSMAFPLVLCIERRAKQHGGFIDHGVLRSLWARLRAQEVLESCAVDKYQKLANLQSAHDYLVSRVEKRQEGQIDLIILCSGSSDSSELDGVWSEGEALSELINYVERSGSSYTRLRTLRIHTVNAAKLQRRRQELTQITPDQPVDDEAVYYKVAGDCPKGCAYSLRSLWRKKRRYVDPDASTSQMLAQRGMGNIMILSNGLETELLCSVSDPLLIRDGSETEYNNFVSDPLLIKDGSKTEYNNYVFDPLLIRD